MTSNPLVTIGIPTYNRADGFLSSCLASALNQTYQNIEIIVSDNCSTDDTGSLMQNYTDERLRYIRHPDNIGAVNNFNFCLREAKGSYFLLLHDDDLIDDDFVECCIKASAGNDYGVIRTGTRIIDEAGNVTSEAPNLCTGSSMEAFCESWFSDKSAMYLCSTLYNTERLRSVGGFHSRKNVFFDALVVLLIASEYPVLNIEAIKATFRKHAGELTFSVTVAAWCDDSLQLIDVVEERSRYNKEKLVKEAGYFFAMLNYRRASAVRLRMKRLWAYFIVMKKFRFKYSPPPLRSILRR